ncbi:MAG TPA: hypothetical protein VEZ90_04400, partial [Blastocatellia bacterium]|nr:hypothetical protein [Blastocatellia bacterium]
MAAIIIPPILFALILGVAALLYGSRRSAELSENREMLRRLGIDLPGQDYQGGVQLAKPVPRTSGTPTILGRLEEAISRAGLSVSARMFLLLMIVLFGAGASAAATWFGLVMALAVGAAFGSLPVFYLKFRRGQRLKAFNRQLPYVLDLLRSALESGHTLLRGLQMGSENLADPMSSEIRLVLEQVQLGV